MARRLIGVALTSVATAGLALTAASFVAHRLGPIGMGEYQAVVRWASIWMILGMFGFAHASSFFAARSDATRIRALVGNSIWTSLIQAAVLVPLGYLIAPHLFHGPSGLAGANIFLLYIPINLIVTNLAHIAIGRLNTRVFNTLRLVQSIAFLLLVIPLVLILRTSVAPLAAVVGAAAASLGYLLWIFNQDHGLRLMIDRALWKMTASYGVKAYVGVVGRELNLYVDQLLVSLLLPPQYLGLYAVAVSGASVISIASAAFFYLAQPEAQNAAPGATGTASAAMCRLTIATLLPMAVVLSLAMPFLVPLVYGVAFGEAVPAAQVLCFAAALDGLVATLAGTALGIGRPILTTIAQAGAVAGEIVLILLLLPTLGIFGAAIASVLAYAVCAGVLVLTLSRGLNLGPTRFLIPTGADLRFGLQVLRTARIGGRMQSDSVENRPRS